METSTTDKTVSPASGTETLKGKIALINYSMLGFFLFFSEFTNAVFNNKLDSEGIPFIDRIAFAFKPTVVILYVIFATMLYLIILRQLKPLFQWLQSPVYKGPRYKKARTAAIRIPWNILTFQVVAWSVGTTAYYVIHGFQAESGIPYIFGLLIKISVGIISGIYTSILINLTLIPEKDKLKIRSIRPGENEGFSRVREMLVLISSSLYIVITLSYLAYYYARVPQFIPGAPFYFKIFAFGLTGMLISGILMALSRWEYQQQIQSVLEVVDALAHESSDPEKRINIMTFNELGEIAQFVNRILNNFKKLMEEIQGTSETIAESTQKVSSAAKENASYANEQASSTTEVVSTMENVNELSRKVDEQVDQVARQSIAVKEHVKDGFSTIHQNIDQMKSVKESYAETFEGISNLGELIKGVWEIVKMINGIAGQIKIIAFNATLEASAAGEAGKNFEIVATEIRRLADNTVDSTQDIKNIIGEIQEASNRLAELSVQDSGKIKEAWQMSQKVEGLFSQILEASEASTQSAEEIQGSINQQVSAYEQILITMKQISSAISRFSGSIDEGTSTAIALDDTVKVLNGIVQRYGTD